MLVVLGIGGSYLGARAAIEFVKSTMQVIFLLNGKYMPYYKWSFRALSALPTLGSLSYSLEFIISSDNSGENSKLKYDMIEDIAALIIEELKSRSLTDGICSDLEKHAYSVNDRVSDNDIRNKNILFAQRKPVLFVRYCGLKRGQNGGIFKSQKG